VHGASEGRWLASPRLRAAAMREVVMLAVGLRLHGQQVGGLRPPPSPDPDPNPHPSPQPNPSPSPDSDPHPHPNQAVGIAEGRANFTYHAPPVISSIFPSSGPVALSTPIVVHGANLGLGTSPTCRLTQAHTTQERPSARLAGSDNLTLGRGRASLNCTVDASWGEGEVSVLLTRTRTRTRTLTLTLTLTPNP